MASTAYLDGKPVEPLQVTVGAMPPLPPVAVMPQADVAAIREWLAALAPETDEQKRLGNSVAQLLDTYDNTSGCKANLIRRMADAKRKYEEEE